MLTTTKCCGCHACYSICPHNCIFMKSDELGFLYPKVDESSCIHCNLCELICPALNETEEQVTSPFSFGGHAIKPSIRHSSSSGGVFYLLAAKVIREGGVAFGAALAENMRSVHHVRVDEISDLFKLQGSKYVQSEIGDCYKEVAELLRGYRYVLFSGTPCQVEGLNRYLEKAIHDINLLNNIITVEVICHGTPSPKLYEKYIDEMENKLGNRITGVFFRDELGADCPKTQFDLRYFFPLKCS